MLCDTVAGAELRHLADFVDLLHVLTKPEDLWKAVLRLNILQWTIEEIVIGSGRCEAHRDKALAFWTDIHDLPRLRPVCSLRSAKLVLWPDYLHASFYTVTRIENFTYDKKSEQIWWT